MTTQQIILGPPGTGKTTKCISIVDDELQSGIRPEQILFTTFTKKGANEAILRACEKFKFKRAQLPYFRTIHSLVFQELHLAREDVMQLRDYKRIGDALGLQFGYTDLSEGMAVPTSNIGDQMLYVLGLSRARMVTEEEQFHELDFDFSWYEFKRFLDTLSAYKEQSGLLDFSDMLDRYIADGGILPIKAAIVDEAQDLSKQQWKVIDIVTGGADRKYIAGDDDQCQPAKSMIWTPSGEVPIEKLVDGDEVVSYNIQGSQFNGRKIGHKVRTAKRKYTGVMYSLSTQGKTMQCTDNHLVLAQFNRTVECKVVYLMKRGCDYRIGQCQLFNSEGANRLSARLKSEKADAVWILEVVADRQSAFLREQIIALKYGLPQIVFVVDKLHNVLSQCDLDSIYASTNTEARAATIFKDYNLNLNYPFWTNNKSKLLHNGSKIFTMEACNLFDDIFLLPTRDGEDKVIWSPCSISKNKVNNVDVYSLDVDRFHNYISDGIITHNCIFKWSGADVDAFLNLTGGQTVLGKSYRLPSVIHEYSNRISQQIEHRYKKEWTPSQVGGSVEFVNSVSDVDIREGSNLLLARNKYLLKQYEEFLRTEGYPYIANNSSSIDQQMVLAIKAWEALRAGKEVDVAHIRAAYKFLKVGHGVTRGYKSLHGASGALTIVELKDKWGLLTDAIWHDALIEMDDAEYYLAALRRGEKLDKEPRIQLSTIHTVKGGEADHVVIISDVSRKTYQEIESDGEHRVFYVAATRARKSLQIVLPQTTCAYQFP
jgi:superfamily I DNA/RNA helicase